MSFLYVLGLGLVVLLSYPIATGTNAASAIATGVFFIGSLVLYFCPTIVASAREHPRKVPVIILNVLLGWTLVGWVIALVWAYSTPERSRAAAGDPAPPDSSARMRDAAANPGLVSPDELPAHDIRRRNPPPAAAPALKLCPFCAEEVKVEAIKCKHCGSALPATPT